MTTNNTITISNGANRPACLGFWTILLLALLTSNAHAQTKMVGPLDGTTPPGLSPGAPAGSFPLSDFDNINLFNGNLNFNLPLLSIGGRGGAQHGINLPIEQHWYVRTLLGCEAEQCSTPLNFTPTDYQDWWTKLKPGYGAVVVKARWEGDGPDQCQGLGVRNSIILTRMTAIMPDGTEYDLRDQLTGGRPMSVPRCSAVGASRGTIWTTTDGTSATFISSTEIVDPTNFYSGTQSYTVSGDLLLRDGTHYHIIDGLTAWMQDRNGNRITFFYTPAPEPDGVSQWKVSRIVDSLGREVRITYADYTTIMEDRITYSGFNGAQRTIRIGYATLDQVLRPGYTIKTDKELFPEFYENITCCFGPYVPFRVAFVEMPDGRRYRFFYNDYGELARVELPTGGAYEYDWTPGTGVIFSSPDRPAIYRRVIKRRVYPNGSTGSAFEREEVFTASSFGRDNPYNSLTNFTKVEIDRYKPGNPLVRVAHEKHYFNGDVTASLFQEAFQYTPWRFGKEEKTEIYADDASTLLRRVEQTRQQRAGVDWWPPIGSSSLCPSQECAPTNDPRIIETVTTLADANLVSKQTFGYDQYNNQTDVYEYDFSAGAPGPLIRHTHTDYVTLNNGVNYAADTNIHIRSLPLQQQVFDAGEVLRAQITYEYDNYNQSNPDVFHAALSDYLSISGHDGAFSTGYLPRGNVTKTTRSLLNNSGGVTDSISSYVQYDIAGNVVKAIDPRSTATPLNIIATTFDFSDRFGLPNGESRANTAPPELGGQTSYAFPTKVTDALGQTTYSQYDYYLGRAVDGEDHNGMVSSGFYNDALDRPTQIIRANTASPTDPNRSQTTFIYNDASHLITTTSDRDAFSDNLLKSEIVYDGLGRTVEARTYAPGPAGCSSPCYSQVKTTFDAMGRTYQVSNPYWNHESPIWTTTQYDALSRVVSVTTPDVATVSTAYNGAQVTVTDQAGKKRRSQTDALGRLTMVTEDPGGLNYDTVYLYDALGNLRKVTQGAQTRWFAYDSLSRLIRSKNPEQNTNGSLPAYTDPVTGGSGWAMAYSYDPNGNLTGRIDALNITTTIIYDKINRPTSRSYTDGTPAVNYLYDAQALPAGAPSFDRGKSTGRLVAVTYGGGSQGSYYGYDSLGRVLRKFQQTGATNYQTQATYNKAGAVTGETYPSGRTVTYTYNTAGQLSDFSGTIGDGVSRIYASVTRYSAAGLMERESYGTGANGMATPLYHNLHYNSRLQLVDNRLGDSATDEWSSSRGAISFLYGTTAVSSGNLFANDTDNNGNLRRQINYVPLASGGNVIPQQHDYTYDPLNRIATVREQQRNGSGQWADSVSQAYSYDRWGNRTLDLSGGGSGAAVWVDDALPAGATVGSDGGDSWNWLDYSPAPYSGSVSHQSNIAAGSHQHGFVGASQPLQLCSGDRLYTYVYLDPANPPSEIMLQWQDGSGSWEHRAYWGANNITWWGTDGTNSRRYMGTLPAAGVWVMLAVPASAVGLQGGGGSDVGAAYGMAFTLYGGRANWDQAGKTNLGILNGCFDMVWVEDGLPAGATGFGDSGDGWTWVGWWSPGPYSGSVSHQSNIAAGEHQHFFYGTTQTLQVNSGDRLYAYVYLDPANIPSEVMLQCNDGSGWEHRAYWGTNNIGWGVNGTESRRYMGPLPPAGQWVRLEVPASAVGLEGKILNGMAFTLYGGRANWDKAGKDGPLAGAGPPINNRVYTVDAATNRLTSVNGAPMGYDAAGNLTSDSMTGGIMIFDAENRLLTATNGGGGSYTYDGDGKRVKRITAGQEWWYVYGIGGELVAEYLASAPATVKKEYGYRGGQLLVVWNTDEPLADKKLKWLVTDHLGSTRMEADKSGSLAGITRHDYAPFGEEMYAGIRRNGSGQGQYGYEPPQSNVRQKFGSKERDNETGLDYFLARYYSSIQGRFTSPDEFNDGPIELFSIAASSNPTFYADLISPQSLNKYQYCYNNPLRYTDPYGHAPDGDGIVESIKNYLWSLLKDKVNWKTEEEPKRSDPSIAGVPSGDKIVEKHFEALVTTSEINANIISLIDPTGASSVVMNYMQGNKRDAAIAAVGAAVGVFGQFGKAGTLRASEALAQIAAGAAEEGITVTRSATLRATEVIIPTRQEAEKLIGSVGGVVQRVDKGANATVSTHNFPHINYTVGNQRYTVRVQSVGKEFDRTGRYKFRGGIRQPE